MKRTIIHISALKPTFVCLMKSSSGSKGFTVASTMYRVSKKMYALLITTSGSAAPSVSASVMRMPAALIASMMVSSSPSASMSTSCATKRTVSGGSALDCP